jgi:hypothetical protein
MRRFHLIALGLLAAFFISSPLAALPPASAQVTEWCYRFDFTVSDGGWGAYFSSSPSQWVSGSGWQAAQDGATTYRAAIDYSVPLTHFTYIELSGTATGAYLQNYPLGIRMFTDGGANRVLDYLPGWSINSSWTVSASVDVSADYILLYNPVANYQYFYTSSEFHGTGLNPFGVDNCIDDSSDPPPPPPTGLGDTCTLIDLTLDETNAKPPEYIIDSPDAPVWGLGKGWLGEGELVLDVQLGLNPILVTSGAIYYRSPGGVVGAGVVNVNDGVNYTYVLNNVSFDYGVSESLVFSGVLAAGDKMQIQLTLPTDDDIELFYVVVCSDAPELTRPLMSHDRYTWDVVTHNPGGNTTLAYSNGLTVIDFSSTPGALVRSAFDGIVVDIRSDVRCGDLIALDCSFGVPAESRNDDSEGDYIYTWGGSGSLSGIDDNQQAVLIRDNETGFIIVYLVQNAYDYIAVGDSVRAGCYLGVTAPVAGYDISISLSAGIYQADFGAVVMGYYSDSSLSSEFRLPLLQFLTIEPSESNPCNTASAFESCYGDSAMANPAAWDTSGGVTWGNGGVVLNPIGAISETMNLDPDRLPVFILAERGLGGAGRVTIQIGTHSQTFDVATTPGLFTVPAAAYVADDGGFYTIAARNDGTESIEINYLCTRHTLDGDLEPIPVAPSQQCYFENYSFEDLTAANYQDVNPAGWSLANPAAFLANDGALEFVDSSSISQDAALPPGDYRITVVASIAHDGGFTPVDSDVESIPLTYEFPGGGGAVALASHTIGDFARYGMLSYTTDFNVASDTSGVFNLFVDLSSVTVSKGVNLVVNSVCLEPSDGGGFEDKPPDPFPSYCGSNPRPSGNGVGAWTAWHWNNLRGFFDCELMLMLNDIYKAIMGFFDMVGWSVRYFKAAMFNSVYWLESDLLPWIGGYLTNASGNVFVEYSGDAYGSCEWWNLLCHISHGVDVGGGVLDGLFGVIEQSIDKIFAPLVDMLGQVLDFLIYVLGGAVDIIFNLVNSLITFGFRLAVMVTELFAGGRDVLLVIVTSYSNAAPEPLPGLPDCSVYSTDQHMLCWLYYTMEYTVFSGSEGALIIPLFTGLLSILLLISYVKQIKSMVMETGRVL